MFPAHYGFQNKPLAGKWLVSVPSSSYDQDTNGWNGYTLRQIFYSAGISNTGGTKIRVTINAGHNEGVYIAKCYIGKAAASGHEYDFAAAPTQVTWDSGNAYISISANDSEVSDEITFELESGEDYIIAMYFNSSNDSLEANVVDSNFSAYYKSGDDVATVDASGYNAASSDNVGCIKIESYI